MVEYIKEFVRIVLGLPPQGGSTAPARGVIAKLDSVVAVIELAKETDRLDPRDFEPSFQVEFLCARTKLAWLAGQKPHHPQEVKDCLNPLLSVLDHYRGPGSFGVTRQFPYLTDNDLRRIVERDYVELVVYVYPSGAWKSTVILAGSILEAILFDRLADKKWKTQAEASPKAPTVKGNKVPMDDWKLEKLISVSVDIGLLKQERAETIDQVLRDYRNFVHPKKEIRSAHECTEDEAMLAVGALNGVCSFLEKNP
jgi:hypothetical protein